MSHTNDHFEMVRSFLSYPKCFKIRRSPKGDHQAVGYGGESKKDDESTKKSKLGSVLKRSVKDDNKCPQCGETMLKTEGCSTCPSCAFSMCSV